MPLIDNEIEKIKINLIHHNIRIKLKCEENEYGVDNLNTPTKVKNYLNMVIKEDNLKVTENTRLIFEGRIGTYDKLVHLVSEVQDSFEE